ncbi:MAG: CHAP domain-containing protein [Rhodoferax sp.]|uniref:CHAP domain-containing protein n=1 Tax=Rhodoferax sp. TaxID=50421 RepID=UPI003267FBD5
MTDVQTVLGRAVSIVGRHTVYWAGAGGFDPQADSPVQPLAIGQQWPSQTQEDQAIFRPLAEAAGLNVDDPKLVAPACDCSGFVCWALGISRHPNLHTWINTDTIWDDANGRSVQFRRIERAVVGCIVVYPTVEGHKYGHIALVTEIDANGRATRIVHCSADNFGSAPPDAIKITGPKAFEAQSESIYAWFLGMKA